ncbi:MAG TPA: hypothetical protein DCO82_03630, partial [Alphaproteobacteria bacterium]|nr:hypothetical protein [Alphaproteobacteria bacterium]
EPAAAPDFGAAPGGAVRISGSFCCSTFPWGALPTTGPAIGSAIRAVLRAGLGLGVFQDCKEGARSLTVVPAEGAGAGLGAAREMPAAGAGSAAMTGTGAGGAEDISCRPGAASLFLPPFF